MANSTILVLTQEAMQEMGVALYGQPATVIGNTNTDVVQTLALMNGYARQLTREFDWNALDIEYRFTTVFYQYTATTTDGSTTISALSSTTGLTTNPTYFMVTGTGIPQDTYLVSVDSGASTAVLSQEATETGTAVTLTFSQTMYALPTDFDRQVDRTQWDKSRHWEMLGPETAQQWQWLKSGWISTGPRVRYRILGNLFQIWPPLSSEDYLGWEYLSKYWVYATGGATPTKRAFTVDTDTCIFPDALMNAMIKRAYFKAKGFSPVWDEDYAAQVDIAKANDQGSATLSFAPRPSQRLIGWDNIPDANFGS